MATKADCDKISQIYEKILQHSSNASNVDVWLAFIDYLEALENIYPRVCPNENAADLE